MKKHQRDEQGRAIKFKDTPRQRFNRKIKFSLYRLMARGMGMQALTQINQIQQSPAKTKEEKTRKALAIAEVITNSAIAQRDLLNRVCGQ